MPVKLIFVGGSSGAVKEEPKKAKEFLFFLLKSIYCQQCTSTIMGRNGYIFHGNAA